MKLSINYILTIISLILYALSPKEVFMPIIIADFFVFALGVYDILTIEWRGGFKLSFNFIFLLSFFFVSFSFALFIVNSDQLFEAFAKLSAMAFKYIDFSYITQAVSLCLIAINFYLIGYKRSILHSHERVYNDYSFKVTRYTNQRARFWVTFFWLLTVANIYFSLRSSRGSATNLSERTFIYEFYKCALAISLVVSGIYYTNNRASESVWFFFRNNSLVVIEALSIVSFQLFIGDRGNAVAIFLLLLCGCAFYYYEFRLSQFVLIGTVGVIMLFAIRETRHSDNALSNSDFSSFSHAARESIEGQNALFLFSDLIGASQELCIGYAIKEERGLQTPEQIFLIPLYPFPFLPSLGSELLFHKPLNEISGVQAFSDYLESSIGFTSTYGKHCVSDIYMRWGLLGVFIFFYLFGIVIGFFYQSKDSKVYSAAIYLALLSTALYLPRSSVFDIIRVISFTYILYYIYVRRGVTHYYTTGAPTS